MRRADRAGGHHRTTRRQGDCRWRHGARCGRRARERRGAAASIPRRTVLGESFKGMSLFFFQLAYELKKMFARKRTYIGFGAFFVMECLMLFGFNTPGTRRHIRHMLEENGYAFDEYFSGLTIAFDIVSF